ncbi:hypothetical protein ABBQ38_010129 [Trebouxia sp. C0009 RCD-2024]
MDSGRLSITIPIREGVPADLVKNEVLKQMKRLSQAGAGRFFVHKQAVSPGSERMVSTVVPSRGNSEGLQAELESHRLRSFVRFAKRGPVTDGELAVISAVLRAANLLTGDEAAAVASAQAIRKVRSDIEEDWRRLHEAAPGVMLSLFRDLVAGISANVQDSEPVAGGPKDSTSTAGSMQPPWGARRHPQGRPLFDDPSPPETAEEKFEYGSRRADQAAQKLQSLGAMVYPPTNQETFDWGILAGYADQKQQIEDTMLLALKHPHVYEAIAKSTRRQHGNNKPRAVLFEGPPGTGKTTSARVIASQASVPLVYVPLEAVTSKWYGESERLLADVFKAAEVLPGCIIFLDEIDSLATSRSSDMHEATRRVLGVLLRHLDGFETNKGSVVIAATNRKEDLDPALLSRFNTSVQFGLPDETCRAQILQQYAKHLKEEDLAMLAKATPGLAGRDLKDLSEQAERSWASKIIRKLVPENQYEPPVEEYIAAARQRVKEKQTNKQRRSFSLL